MTATQNNDTSAEAIVDGLNEVHLAGVLVRVAECRPFESGNRRATVLVRVPTFAGATTLPVTVWNPAEDLESAADGARVRLAATLRRSSWVDGDGRRRFRNDIVAQDGGVAIEAD